MRTSATKPSILDGFYIEMFWSVLRIQKSTTTCSNTCIPLWVLLKQRYCFSARLLIVLDMCWSYVGNSKSKMATLFILSLCGFRYFPSQHSLSRCLTIHITPFGDQETSKQVFLRSTHSEPWQRSMKNGFKFCLHSSDMALRAEREILLTIVFQGFSVGSQAGSLTKAFVPFSDSDSLLLFC